MTADTLIRRLQYGYREDHAGAVATLARLRRGAGKPAHAVPDLWGLTGLEELTERLNEVPEAERAWHRPEHAEEALHLAVTLWALHQQSHRSGDMHVRGWGLGEAVRELMRRGSGAASEPQDQQAAEAPAAGGRRDADDIDEALRRRFVRLSTASALPALSQRLREIVLLLRRATVPLDYGLLAEQVCRWQSPAHRAAIHRVWGRDFHLAGARRLPAPRAAENAPDTPAGPGGPADTTGP